MPSSQRGFGFDGSSTLARHRADRSPERLREIYERAGLRVLDKYLRDERKAWVPWVAV